MTIRTMMLPALAALLAVGCGSEDQLRRVEQEASSCVRSWGLLGSNHSK